MKLLDRSIQSYLLYAIGILTISIPLFYLVIQGIISRDVDRGLRMQKTEIVKGIERTADRDPFSILDAFGPDIFLNRLRVYHTYDTIYTTLKLNPATNHFVSYRVLESNVVIRGLPYKIVVQNSLVSSQDLIKSIVFIIALLLLVIVVGMLLINRILSKKIWRPFNHTLSQIQQFRVDDPIPVELQDTDIDEFNSLNTAISALAENNRQLFFSQKEFTENASHEMQTPLAVLQGKLDLLMQTNPLTPEQASLIGELSDASLRLTRLNKTLLLLTRIENNQFTEKERIPIHEIVEKSITNYSEIIDSKNIHAQLNLEPAYCLMNKTLCEILINNLISNATRYNIPGGELFIQLKNNILIIRNDGNPAPLDSDKIFKRFFKSSTDKNSIGLGLEIAHKICTLSGYPLQYRFEENLHSFQIDFNKKS